MHHIFTRTIADVHGGRERPEPKVAGRRERQRGNTSPAEGKGKVAAGNIGSSIRKYISNVPLAPVGRGPSGYILPRVSFATLILPWARFLLGLAFSDLRFSPYKSYKVSLLSVDYLQAGCR